MNIVKELKKVWDMKVTVLATVVGALETVKKNQENRLDKLKIRGRFYNIQTTAALK